MAKLKPPSLGQCFAQTLRACLTNLACAPFFLVAVLFYAFYYCWPYSAQLPEHLHTAIVDEDNSPLSRRLCRALEAAPQYSITLTTTSRPYAVRLMRQAQIASIIGIPPDFEKNILNDVPVALTLVTNGSFIVKAHAAMTGAEGPLEQLAQKAIMEELVAHGIPASSLTPQGAKAPPVLIEAMYNTISGYLSFAVSIVFVIIFQTIMMCGFAMLLNAWFSQKEWPQPLKLALGSPLYLLAMQAPVLCICIFWIMFVEGWAFYWQGINSFQNPGCVLCTSFFFAWAVTSLGLALALVFRNSHFAIHAIVLSSLPCVFISGNLYPWQDIPVYMRALAWLIPSTPGVDAMLRSSQAGASILEVFPYLGHLFFLGCLYFCIAWLLTKKIRNSLAAK